MMEVGETEMPESPSDDRFNPLQETALDRVKRDPTLLARLRKSIEARQRGERPIPATELMSEGRPTGAGALQISGQGFVLTNATRRGKSARSRSFRAR